MASPATPLPLHGAAPLPAADAQSYPGRELNRLATLHREAEETARLANLLGRAPVAAAMLAISTGLVAALAVSADPAEITAWAVLMLVAVAAATRSYMVAIRQPFERAALKGFADDLAAILTYAGFAWGAGVFLALPANTGPVLAAAFAAVPCAALAVLLRAQAPVLGFLVPLAALASLSMLVRLPEGAAAAALTLALTGLVAGILLWREGFGRDRSPRLASLPFA